MTDIQKEISKIVIQTDFKKFVEYCTENLELCLYYSCFAYTTDFFDYASKEMDKKGKPIDYELVFILSQANDAMLSYLKTVFEVDTQCCICTQNTQEHNRIVLKCKHCYHYSCIRSWMEHFHNNDATCPICRRIMQELYEYDAMQI